jgi:diguanylate cyclase (GGDEF)-like protein/PAS domain S-box-containing protein
MSADSKTPVGHATVGNVLGIAGCLAAAEAAILAGFHFLDVAGWGLPSHWATALNPVCLALVGVPMLRRMTRRPIPGLIDALPDPLLVIDGDRIASGNAAASQLFGYTADELAGMRLSTLFPADADSDGELAAALLQHAAASPAVTRRLVTARSKDGQSFAARLSLSVDLNGERPLLIAVVADFREQQLTERRLRESEERFRTMADRAPIMMWMDSAEDIGHGIYYNKAWLDFTGRPLEAELGMDWQASLHPDDHDRHFGPYREAYAARREFTAIYRLRRHDGEWRWIGDHGVPRFDADGTFLGYIGVSQDITEEYRAREIASRNQTMQLVLNRLLALPIHTASLSKLLGEALDTVLQLSWLGLSRSSGLYLFDTLHQRFELAAQRNLPPATKAGPVCIQADQCACCVSISDEVGFHQLTTCANGDASFPRHYCVPLRHNGQRLGALLLGVGDDHQPTPESRALLTTLGATLAGVIDRKRSVEALRATAKAVSTGTGAESFQRIAVTACRVLGMDACVIGKRLGQRDIVETMVVCVDGRIDGNYSYLSAGTHCEQVLAGTVCCINDIAQRQHRRDILLNQMGMRSYIGYPLRNANGNVIGVMAMMSRHPDGNHDAHVDLLQIFAARAAQELERQDQLADLHLAAHAFETLEGIFITDPTGRIERVNTALTEITGYTTEELVGQNPRLFKSGRQDEAYYRHFWDTLRREGRWQGEIWNRRKNGEIYPSWQSITAVRRSDGSTSHYVAALLDMSERKAAEARIERLAYYDELTGLANRRLLQSRIEQSLAHAVRSDMYGALIFVDLDHFKNINDALGHAVGDALLELVAHRLKIHLRSEDTVARLGGDEFVILLPSLHTDRQTSASQAQSVAEKIRMTLNDPYPLSGNPYHVSPSIGVTLFPEGIRDADELLKRADTAMYRAKAQGRNCIAFYEPAMQAAVESRLRLQKDLRHAIDADELLMVFQPQVDRRGRIVGAEALVRWQHPERGLVSPAEFIPAAEDTGLIIPLGEWVLRASLHLFEHLRSRQPTVDLRLSVNMSARQFMQPDSVERILSIAESTGADLRKLTIEFTESIFIDYIPETIRKMMVLKQHGVTFSIDDFGTGYSSLTYLKRLPIDEVKIDRSFVKDITVDPSDAAIVETILSVATHLNLRLVAEGVETPEQLSFLCERGCEHFQGFLFSKPQPFEVFERLLMHPTQQADKLPPTRTLRTG